MSSAKGDQILMAGVHPEAVECLLNALLGEHPEAVECLLNAPLGGHPEAVFPTGDCMVKVNGAVYDDLDVLRAFHGSDGFSGHRGGHLVSAQTARG